METNKIYQGDVIEVLKTFPDESVDCIITSPPYYGLRDYGAEGQIGLEKTLNEYLDKMLLITTELKRVLKKTGTLWWNHGDSYGTGSGAGIRDGKQATNRGTQTNKNWQKEGKAPIAGYEKSPLLQAHRLAIKMCDEQGWILRNTIIWHKPNCMPSSVKDRFTVDYEPVFFFVKSNDPQYWVNEKTHQIVTKQPKGTQGIEGEDWEWVEHSSCRGKGGCETARCINGKVKSSFWEGKDYWFEPQFEAPVGEWGPRNRDNFRGGIIDPKLKHHGLTESNPNPLGRNKRAVWKIPTKPFAEAHFATFPPALIETPIKAGCPEFICKKCGVAREKIYKASGGTIGKGWHDHSDDARQGILGRGGIPPSKDYKVEERGYTNCSCNAGWTSGIVLDPFMGSGTVAVVAEQLNRQWIGIELNPEYIKIAEARIAAIPPSLL
jgi:site-specific DNA-methyltransferase (adenine-specific)